MVTSVAIDFVVAPLACTCAFVPWQIIEKFKLTSTSRSRQLGNFSGDAPFWWMRAKTVALGFYVCVRVTFQCVNYVGHSTGVPPVFLCGSFLWVGSSHNCGWDGACSAWMH